jgi:hypothetical protein
MAENIRKQQNLYQKLLYISIIALVLSMVSMSSTLIGCVQAVSELNYSKLEEVQIAEGNYSKWLDYSDMADCFYGRDSKDINRKL